MRPRLALAVVSALAGVSGLFGFDAPAPRRLTLGGGGGARPRKGSNHARRIERRRVHAARMATIRAGRR